MDGKERTKVKVNDSLRGQGLSMQMRKRMWHCKRVLMQLDRDMSHSSSIEVLVLVGWSFGHLARPQIYSAQEAQIVGDVG